MGQAVLGQHPDRLMSIHPETACKAMFLTTILPLVAVFCIGCASVGYVAGGSTKTFSGSYTLELQEPRADILDVIAEVGQAMGHSVSGLDRENKFISLSTGSSVLTTGVMGKYSQTTISVTVTESGKKLDVLISVVGNFGKGTQKAADNLFNDFREKLLAKINS